MWILIEGAGIPFSPREEFNEMMFRIAVRPSPLSLQALRAWHIDCSLVTVRFCVAGHCG